jgi:hypothetical protein
MRDDEVWLRLITVAVVMSIVVLVVVLSYRYL